METLSNNIVSRQKYSTISLPCIRRESHLCISQSIPKAVDVQLVRKNPYSQYSQQASCRSESLSSRTTRSLSGRETGTPSRSGYSATFARSCFSKQLSEISSRKIAASRSCLSTNLPADREDNKSWSPLGLVDRKRRCRAQAAASDLGMTDSALVDLSRVPFLEVLTSERAKVVMLVAMAMALCNADRVVMSVAILPLSATYGWTTSFGGIIQSSFLWGYLLSPIPGGLLADRYGGKEVMGWGVALWSLATLLTPWAARHSMGMLLAVRILMGLAEGVALPCMNNIIAKWFPKMERASAVGVTMAGFHLGSVSGLLFSPELLKNYGVSGPFWVFGLLGFLWLTFWCPFISKDPHTCQHITSIEYDHICHGHEQQSIPTVTKKTTTGLPLNLIFSKLPVWAIIFANAMNNWGYFVLLSWMPVYFSTVLGVNLQQAAWLSALPWATMACAGFVAGAASDALVKFGANITTVRKVMQSVGFVGPAAALLQLNSVTEPAVASLWLTAALGSSAFSQAGFLINHQEIAPKYAGFLHGVSNTVGTLAAIVSTVGTGYFIERLGSFQAFLSLTAILYVVSAIIWNYTASGKQVIF